MMFFSTRGLVVVSAFLASLSTSSGAPLRGSGNPATQGDAPKEEGRLAPFQAEGHVSRGLLKKGGITSDMEVGRRKMKPGKGKGKGGNKPKECKVSKKGSPKGDCSIMDLLMARKEDFSLFIEAVDRLGLVGNGIFLDDLWEESTVFVPTNEAFLKNPNLFKYFDTDAWSSDHVFTMIDYLVLGSEVVTSEDFVDGQAILTTERAAIPSDAFINLSPGNPPVLTGPFIPSPGIKIIEVDNFASNGVFHVLDGVAVPLSLTPQVDIVGAASVDPNFSKMFQLLAKVNLIPWLRTPGPIHIFAIPDAIFDTIQFLLIASDLALTFPTFNFFNELMNDPNLRLILENHLILGELPCFEPINCNFGVAQPFTSVAGNPIEVTKGNPDVVNGVNIRTSFLVSNGSIDVLQGVLLLPGGRPDWLPEPIADYLENQVKLISFGPVA